MKKLEKFLPHHASYWKHDLARPHETVKTPFPPIKPGISPNHIDGVFLELSRSTIRIRGIPTLVGITGAIPITYYFWHFLAITFELENGEDTAFTFLGIAAFIAIYWLLSPFVRLDIQLPRDEPIRFNRLRRQVYFYHYKFDRIRIFSRDKWGIKPEVHAWDDLKAEVCRVYAPGHGGLIENIVIAAHKPGTDQVIARYFFAHDIHNGEHYWAIARLFMQQGPDALPEFEKPARDWNNDAEVGFPRRLAPKVKWPADIDYESRTAPTEKTK